MTDNKPTIKTIENIATEIAIKMELGAGEWESFMDQALEEYIAKEIQKAEVEAYRSGRDKGLKMCRRLDNRKPQVINQNPFHGLQANKKINESKHE